MRCAVSLTFALTALLLATPFAANAAAAKCDRLIATGGANNPPFLWRDPQNPKRLVGANADLLKQMQEGMEEGNKERKELGYPAMSLVGWAEKPHYDKAQHKLYWAKELRTEGASANGLNYNIRVLGREGVLVLNAVAAASQLDAVKKEMQDVTAFTNFNTGHRYADFNESTDKVAEYGIAALVAGGVAAKLGFFGKLLGLLVAFKKLIILAVAGLGSLLWKFFRREKKVDLSKPD